MTQAALEILGVSKSFGSAYANEDISLSVNRGEIIALLGENGAGKTTLMNIIFGHYLPDQGRVRVFGTDLPLGRPRAAIRAGIGMVHQHFALAPNLTVLENIITGTESLWKPAMNIAAARRRLDEVCRRFGLDVRPDARLGDLSVGEQQRVEILKALYNEARILVLDEPTAVLTNIEAEKLFATLKEMVRFGLSVIFISHKLDEVMAAADRIFVLRAGRLVAERQAASTSKHELAALMVGHAVRRPERPPGQGGGVLLQARGITVQDRGLARLKAVDFDLRAGEILGIIGVSGNGQTTLAGILSGTVRIDAGELRLQGKDIANLAADQLVSAGIGRIPEDRNREGVIGQMAIWENVVLERLSRFSRYGLVDRQSGIAFAEQIISSFDLRGGTAQSRTALLSGGNIQKLILGRNLIEYPRVLIAAQPARGLDEGAISAVHAHILQARARGTAVLLISEDLDEVMALADRIQPIVAGRLGPAVRPAEVDARSLGLMMAGEWKNAGVRI
jgi:ABC-type uncharacterized transport system ATPase subunit